MSDLDAAFARILDGQATLKETKAFLTESVALMGDGEALAAGARAMRARMIRVSAPENAIDVCGTGGDGARTLNISTAVAFVVAGAGTTVAKHGNRAMTSRSGAADVLEALGVKLTNDIAVLERCLREANLAFLFTQNHHPSMRHVAQARRELGHRTIFNLLGPLSNPAGVTRQLLGVFALDFLEPVAAALILLGCERALVVHGAGGLDELSAAGEAANEMVIVRDGRWRRQHASSAAPIDPDLAGGSAVENADELRALLQGKGRPGYRDAVVMNAAAALFVAGRADTIAAARDIAEHSLQSGASCEALEKLIALTQSSSSTAL